VPGKDQTLTTPSARVGIIGCGNISRRYVEGMRRFAQLEIVGCADLVPELAQALAADSGIRAYADIDELLADPNIDIVVNITPPIAHATVTEQAVAAGKHVYVEKPIAATVADAQHMLEAADRADRVLGSAPDTFLGSAGQTARAAIDAGLIGEPIGAVAFVTHSKAETWHPDPGFLFRPGGGPALDLGPYYIAALVNLLGPVAEVAGFSRIGAPTRTVTAPDRRVDSIEVTTPTHAGATVRFASGVIATLLFSFDVWDHHLPKIELYGARGTLSLPDPNEYDGPVLIKGHADAEWATLEPVLEPGGQPGEPVQYLRGHGVADLAAALDGAPQRTSAALALHVLEVLEAIETASAGPTVVTIDSRPSRPEPTANEKDVPAHA
jgi:predicted dehydrogenase